MQEKYGEEIRRQGRLSFRKSYVITHINQSYLGKILNQSSGTWIVYPTQCVINSFQSSVYLDMCRIKPHNTKSSFQCCITSKEFH